MFSIHNFWRIINPSASIRFTFSKKNSATPTMRDRNPNLIMIAKIRGQFLRLIFLCERKLCSIEAVQMRKDMLA